NAASLALLTQHPAESGCDMIRLHVDGDWRFPGALCVPWMRRAENPPFAGTMILLLVAFGPRDISYEHHVNRTR
ncbi:MAG TPA: hypothetical protein VFA39_18370, partial [Steroidobacteraceae bacterium]|nr:hypothetical protein [Steroidobacteraceae bacterium]